MNELIKMLDGYQPKIPSRIFNAERIAILVDALKKSEGNLHLAAEIINKKLPRLIEYIRHVKDNAEFEIKNLSKDGLNKAIHIISNCDTKSHRSNKQTIEMLENLIALDGFVYNDKSRAGKSAGRTRYDLVQLFNRINGPARFKIEKNEKKYLILTHHEKSIFSGVNSIFNHKL
jgi:hypothetical protein